MLLDSLDVEDVNSATFHSVVPAFDNGVSSLLNCFKTEEPLTEYLTKFSGYNLASLN